MNINRVILHNFLPFKDVDIDFSNEGIYNIIGKTGAGKSTIRDGVTWTLFGKSRVDGAGEELIHNNEKEMYCVVEFEHNGNNYRVTRIKAKGESTRLEIEELK